MSLLHSAGADWLKVRKRPAVWIMITVLGLLVLLLGYLALYVVVTQTPPEATAGLDRVAVLTVLSPVNLPGQVLSITASVGGAIGLILGAMTIGGEFSWGTIKTMSTQLPRRTTLLAGHALALLGVCVLMSISAFVGGAIGAYVITLLEPIPAVMPVAVDVATAFGVAVLIIAVWCALGMGLAMLFRGTGWAIGLGLLYLFVLEQVLTALPLPERTAELVEEGLVGPNATALVTWLSSDVARSLGGTVDIPPVQSMLVLGAYLVVAVAVAMAIFARRDIA